MSAVKGHVKTGSLFKKQSKESGVVVQLPLSNHNTGEFLAEPEFFRNLKKAGDVFSLEQAAEFTGLSKKTIGEYRRQGKIKRYSRLSKRVIVYYRQGLEEFMRETYGT